MHTFCKRLTELRKERNITARRLGKEIGVSASTITRWESGEISPKYEFIILLAKFFNVSSDYLLGLSDF